MVVCDDWAAVCLADELQACYLPSPAALSERSTINQQKKGSQVDDWSIQRTRSRRSSGHVPVPAIEASAVDCATTAVRARAERSKVPESRQRRMRCPSPLLDVTQRRQRKERRTTNAKKTGITDQTVKSFCDALNSLTLDCAYLAVSSSEQDRTGAQKK